MASAPLYLAACASSAPVQTYSQSLLLLAAAEMAGEDTEGLAQSFADVLGIDPHTIQIEVEEIVAELRYASRVAAARPVLCLA
ncbi:hypothetical protein [Sphingosinicella sp. BN140058]|uniref:hypothetical protein n=1 Tax=Sphingosinicella sp. BN140058 TaxID=1892855 RepID=UPI001011E63F|nr:hypothetical protein [Sphingosinicella sp. BN140058]QAY80223.1 hypothetical protein ETR14_26635 [Sphingosinicella sp. BN140058]